MSARTTSCSKAAIVLTAMLSICALSGCGESQPETPASNVDAALEAPVAGAVVTDPVADESEAESPVAEAEQTPAPATTPKEAPSGNAPTPAASTLAPVAMREPEPIAPVVERPAAFARCQACHNVQQGGNHGIGPNLFGIMGSTVGARSGFNYSEAMASSDLVWTPERMDAFLAAPRQVIPGTRMTAAPIRNPEDRQALIAYLASLE